MFEDRTEGFNSEKQNESQEQNLSNSKSINISPSYENDSNDEHLDFDSKSSLQLSKSSISHSYDVKQRHLSRSCIQTSDKTVNYSMKTISDMSFNYSKEEIPCDAWRYSEAVTSAKNSFTDEEKKKELMMSVNYSSFAVPSRMFCLVCDKEVFTIVSFQFIEPGFWDCFGNFINSFRCCENTLLEKEKQLVHRCSKCFKVLAKISADL